MADLFAALRGMLRPLLLNQAVDLVFEDVDSFPNVFGRREDFADPSEFHLQFTQVHRARRGAGIGQLAGDDVVFSVADTGIGIAPQDQERIFQDFAQVDNPIQRRVKGTGLGLPLSKKLATSAGRRSTSPEPAGNRVDVHRSVPVAIRAQARLSQASESAVVAAEAETGSLPVLVLEDKVEMIMMYRSYLKNSGFELIPASTIRDAQEVLERFGPRLLFWI